ncbi:MAG: energy-coupling factor transporter ATPase [Deltaproteobacteria bacterium]|nr:energy-coupling factor transporter ATPase [Deltaproteobacteria bacterium]
MIRVENLFYRYETKNDQVLNGISMEIEQGKHIGVIGPNGCGKTTLVRHLNGLLAPTSGEIWVDGMDTRDPVDVQKIRHRVGMVFQNPDSQIVGMSVEEDVSFGPGNLRLPPLEIQKRVEESLATVGMEGFARRPPHTLSNGEKQLVAIAGVLAMEPRHIIFDEPTTYLDPSARERVLQVITGLNEQGITIVHVTHDMDAIAKADEIIVVHEGRIALRARPAEVFARVEWLRDLGIGIPRVTEVMWRLRQKGVNVRTDIFSVEDACSELAALIRPQTG